MKAVVVFAGFLAVALAWTKPPHYDVELKPVDAEFVAHQKKLLSFFDHVEQVDIHAEYYKVGATYDVHANIDNYTNKEAIEEFLFLYKQGFIAFDKVFSIFDDEMREQAISLFHLFYYAKDFDTFYKSVAFGRVHFNYNMFLYALTVATFHRTDLKNFVIPAPHEVYPEFFTNMESIYKARRVKMQNGFIEEKTADEYGILKESDYYVFYSNYSDYWNFENKEFKLTYFTEDIGLNSYYYYFHAYFPFWMESKDFEINQELEERRGERYYFFYQRILAQYYMARLSNGLGEIPDFSWYQPIKTGYTPNLSFQLHPFVGRQNYYTLHTPKNYEVVRFLDTYEKSFLQFLQKGTFKAFNQDVSFYKYESINFIGNYWQGNPALYEHMGIKDTQNDYAYEIVSRYLLSAMPEYLHENHVAPAPLMFYQTSLRDPLFYQLYSKILKYVLMTKQYLKPYSYDYLHYSDVEIQDVKVDKLVTFFEYFDYDFTNSIYKSLEEFKSYETKYKVRQPRLNHKPFSVKFNVKSAKESEVVFKFFLGPKYDSNGYPITLENNWMNFVELDQFKYKLTAGENQIHRDCDDFFWYKEDSVSLPEIYKYLNEGKLPTSMAEDFYSQPKRMMLPKGTKGGFPFQLFVFAYPYEAPAKPGLLVDTKPAGYPFDRPAYEHYFHQPNTYFKDIFIYFEGEEFPNYMNSPYYVPHETKH